MREESEPVFVRVRHSNYSCVRQNGSLSLVAANAVQQLPWRLPVTPTRAVQLAARRLGVPEAESASQFDCPILHHIFQSRLRVVRCRRPGNFAGSFLDIESNFKRSFWMLKQYRVYHTILQFRLPRVQDRTITHSSGPIASTLDR